MKKGAEIEVSTLSVEYEDGTGVVHLVMILRDED